MYRLPPHDSCLKNRRELRAICNDRACTVAKPDASCRLGGHLRGSRSRDKTLGYSDTSLSADAVFCDGFDTLALCNELRGLPKLRQRIAGTGTPESVYRFQPAADVGAGLVLDRKSTP